MDNNTKKCKEVNQEIDNLTSSRTLHSNKFRQHLSTLLLFQEVEHKNLSKQFSRGDAQVKSVKTMSKHLLKLREVHSIELKMLQSFQESFKEITNTNLRWLLSKNGDLSLLEKIEKAQICQICESALSFLIKPVVVIPDQNPEIVETKRKAIISRDNCVRNMTPPQEDQAPSPVAGKRVQTKINLSEYQNVSDRKKYHSNYDVSPVKSRTVDDDDDGMKVFRVNRVGYLFPNSNNERIERKYHSKSPSPIPKKQRDQSVLPKLFPSSGRTVKTEQDRPESIKASNKSYIDFIQESSNNYNKVRLSPILAGNRPASKRGQIASQNNIDDIETENKRISKNTQNIINRSSLIEDNFPQKTRNFQSTLGYLEYLKKNPNISFKPPSRENQIPFQNKNTKLPELQKGPRINQAMEDEISNTDTSILELHEALQERSSAKKSALKSPELRKFVQTGIDENKRIKALSSLSQRKKTPLFHNKSMVDENKHVSFSSITEITFDLLPFEITEKHNHNIVERHEKIQIHKFPSENLPDTNTNNNADLSPVKPPLQKSKFSNIIEQHMKNHKNLPQAIVCHDSESKIEKEVYMQKLMEEKPWLDRFFLTWFKFEDLKENFRLSTTKFSYPGKQKEEFENELNFIQEKIHPLKSKSKDLKTDFELAYDLRYYNRYGDLLLKRIQARNFYERLELKRDCLESEVKAAFRAKALVWHPDNSKKTYKHCFANEKAYINTIAQVFSLIDEAYKTLIHPQSREQYDIKMGFK